MAFWSFTLYFLFNSLCVDVITIINLESMLNQITKIGAGYIRHIIIINRQHLHNIK